MTASVKDAPVAGTRICLMNYTIQCRDVSSGTIGCFLFDQTHWIATGEFRAVSPVFTDPEGFWAWNRANGYPGEPGWIERTEEPTVRAARGTRGPSANVYDLWCPGCGCGSNITVPTDAARIECPDQCGVVFIQRGTTLIAVYDLRALRAIAELLASCNELLAAHRVIDCHHNDLCGVCQRATAAIALGEKCS
jgi:hypothetical protein